MLEGIDILSKTKILDTPLWCDAIGSISLIGIVVGFIIMLISAGLEYKKTAIVSIIGIVVSIILLVLAIAFTGSIDTSRYQYKVPIDVHASPTRRCDEHDVVDQEGKIWTIEDKEK